MPKANSKTRINEGSDTLGFESELWASCNKLRGNMDAAEYKHVILPLISLKYIFDTFEDTHSILLEEGTDPESKDEYLKKSEFWIPAGYRSKDLLERAKTPASIQPIAEFIDEITDIITSENPELEKVLITRFADAELPKGVLREVVEIFSDLPSFGDSDARSKDVVGRVYEFLLGKFYALERRGGEFFTPRTLVRLLHEILQPYQGKIYDGCCGSGGMFIQSPKLIETLTSSEETLIYGQESNPKTWRFAKWNLIFRNIPHDLGNKWESTFTDDLHPELEADFVIVNPPFNLKEWGWGNMNQEEHWGGYSIPPKGNANYAWILHYLLKLSKNGLAGIVLSSGSLSSSNKQDKAIRKEIIANDKLDCVIALPDKLFSNTSLSACVWILANDKKDSSFRNRSGETLFIDCRKTGEMVSRKQREFTKEDLNKISKTYLDWKSKQNHQSYKDELGFCKSVTEMDISEHDGVIVPGRYVGAAPLPEDGEPFEERMERLTKELGEHFQESNRLTEELRGNLGALGFEF